MLGLQTTTTTSSTQIVATTTVTMQPFTRNISAKSVIETKPSSNHFPTPSAPPASGKMSKQQIYIQSHCSINSKIIIIIFMMEH